MKATDILAVLLLFALASFLATLAFQATKLTYGVIFSFVPPSRVAGADGSLPTVTTTATVTVTETPLFGEAPATVTETVYFSAPTVTVTTTVTPAPASLVWVPSGWNGTVNGTGR